MLIGESQKSASKLQNERTENSLHNINKLVPNTSSEIRSDVRFFADHAVGLMTDCVFMKHWQLIGRINLM
jgi:hypothetical protein